MPCFPGCETEKDEKARKECTQRKIMEFVKKNLQYPAMAREGGIEGRVTVTFVVEKDGTVSGIETMGKLVGGGLEDEAKRIVALMNKMDGGKLKWTPGKQRGNPARVRYNLPIVFKLSK
jgi:protein TonB